MENKKKLIEVIPVSEGWLNKYIFSYELDDGSTYSYEVVSREKINSVEDAKRIATKDNAVTIIPFTEDGHLVLTKNIVMRSMIISGNSRPDLLTQAKMQKQRRSER